MSVPARPPIYDKRWSATCPQLTPAQLLHIAADSIQHLGNDIDLQPSQLTLRTSTLHLVLNVFQYSEDSLLFEFQRLSGDRSVFRLIARAIYSSLKLREPNVELCSEKSFLVSPNTVRQISVQDYDGFTKPCLGSDSLFTNQDASMELIEILLHSANSPFLEVHREALICLTALSLQSSSAQILRQITDQVIPVLCQRLKSHDSSVSSFAAQIGINLFGNGVATSSLSTSEQSSLCRALLRKMKERSAPVDSAIESLYNVVTEQSFGLKMSPPICT